MKLYPYAFIYKQDPKQLWKTTNKASTRRGGRKGGKDKNFLQGKYDYLMYSQTFDNECPLYENVHCWFKKNQEQNNKSILYVFF